MVRLARRNSSGSRRFLCAMSVLALPGSSLALRSSLLGGAMRQKVAAAAGRHSFQSHSTAAAAAAKRRLHRSILRASAVAPERSSSSSSDSSSSSSDSSSSSLCRPPTIVGEDGQIPTQYDFAAIEEPLYQWWEQQGHFQPKAPATAGKKPYVIPMPPPNVTGRLHMGHAMFVALQDIQARYHRMRGRPTLWLPGTDHAGIATQLLVERELLAEGTSRVELGREKFLDRVWQYKADKAGAIVGQIRRLGASADWTREKFTLDEDLNGAVVEAFVRLHEAGLVYRGTRMVNWSPNLQTAVSDLEVEFSEEEGKLYYFQYRLSDYEESGEFLPVATTRPETILGDSAVCVHPDDERYKHLIGKTVVLPVDTGLDAANGGKRREIPIIADDYVDMEFGTGALKITPAHDPNDYDLGKKHDLELINIMNKDATINSVGAGGGAYEGLDRYEARDKMWADMEAEGLTIKVEPHQQRVPRSQRGGEVIEPLVSTQWFVQMKGMADESLAAVADGRIQIVPNRFEKMWSYWLDNIQDWCVSRQLWWGHRIPVWYLPGADRSDPSVPFFVARTAEEAAAAAEAAGHAPSVVYKDGGGDGDERVVALEQDDDVLDTWFSSGLWPFATVGWPHEPLESGSEVWEEMTDFERFYPATLLETGYDILFFWVARMVMLGFQLTGKPCFETIYMHGLVRDASGQKMSKTKGNVIDPLDTIDKYGSDALRYSLVTGVTPGQDVPLSFEKIEANRNFANKLWNAGRYLLGNLNDLSDEERASLAVEGPMSAEEMAELPVPEQYIVSKLHDLVESCTEGLEAYNMADAGFDIYQFLWNEYADWFIEVSKTRFEAGGGDDPEAAAKARKVLVYVFDTCLRLLHPFMPFVTEALWQELPRATSHGESLMAAPWPLMEEFAAQHKQGLARRETEVGQFGAFQALLLAIRSARAEYQVDPARKIGAVVRVSDPSLRAFLEAEAPAAALLGRVDASQLSFTEEFAAASKSAVRLVVTEGLEVDLPLDALVDVKKETKRLTKQLEKIGKDVAGLEKRLGSSGFLSKASPEVVAETTGQLEEKKKAMAVVEQSLADLEVLA